MDKSATYLTLKSRSEGIYKEKGSKFIGIAIACFSEEEAKSYLDEWRKEHHQSRHLCYAYRFGLNKEVYRSNDDGEPSNSAGAPILGQIQSFDLSNILIGVVRYYGGTKLGVGGLINAYRTAAREAIDNGEIIEKEVFLHVKIVFGYEQMPEIMSWLKNLNLEYSNQDFSVNCTLELAVPLNKQNQLLDQLANFETVQMESLGEYRKEIKKMKLLEKLVEIRGASSDEGKVASFIIDYVKRESKKWRVEPTIITGKGFQDAVVLVFGEPRTAIYAHMDSIGFSAGYDKELIKVGGPRLIDGIQLVGSDSKGEIETELMVIEHEDGHKDLEYVFDREIDRGTLLTFKPNFRETEEYIQSPYLDNRLGVWNALKVCETLENGAIVFSTYEEHGGNSVGFCAKYLLNEYGVHQALISDITWVTDGVPHGGGVAISMRDSMLPRRSYLDRIIEISKKSGIDFQLEVESAGGSDGGVLQKSDLPIDWCFIGAPEDNVHTPDEKVFKYDIMCMVELYRVLMIKL